MQQRPSTRAYLGAVGSDKGSNLYIDGRKNPDMHNLPGRKRDRNYPEEGPFLGWLDDHQGGNL